MLQDRICLCSAAFGFKYRQLAKLLAQDLSEHNPLLSLVLYTDNPSDFRHLPNVDSYLHTGQFILPYNERRFAIGKALERYPACIYLDCDVRITAPITLDFDILPGITARSCASYQKRYAKLFNGIDKKHKELHKLRVAQKMARKVGLDIRDERLMWVNEFLFIVARDGGKEHQFLELWGKLAKFGSLRHLHKGPCHPIGIAALKTGFPIRYHHMPGIAFFDDRIEKVRISKGESDPEASQKYFLAQKAIELEPSNYLQKFSNKVWQKTKYLGRYLTLAGTLAMEDFDFYYRVPEGSDK
ncbi:MAG: hypothetical protein F6K41_41930 [Symploca sp. SIO3E6]|nr:hypothetical protein [Caldora sp. SIO3E6]